MKNSNTKSKHSFINHSSTGSLLHDGTLPSNIKTLFRFHKTIAVLFNSLEREFLNFILNRFEWPTTISSNFHRIRVDYKSICLSKLKKNNLSWLLNQTAMAKLNQNFLFFFSQTQTKSFMKKNSFADYFWVARFVTQCCFFYRYNCIRIMNQNQVQQTLTSHTFTHSTPKQRIGLEPNIQRIIIQFISIKIFLKKKSWENKSSGWVKIHGNWTAFNQTLDIRFDSNQSLQIYCQ